MNSIEASLKRQYLVLERTSTDVASPLVETREPQATHVHLFSVGDAGCGDPVEEHEEPLAKDEGLSPSDEGVFQSSEMAQVDSPLPVGACQVLYRGRDGNYSLRRG